MLDAGVNSLTFHNMDELFTTRSVPRSGPAWQLPRVDKPLDFTYQYKGAAYTPAQFLECTFTNALLVMKDGRIVAEIYRNNTGPATRFHGVLDDQVDHLAAHRQGARGSGSGPWMIP